MTYVLTESIVALALVLIFCGSMFVRLAFKGHRLRQSYKRLKPVTVLMACFNEGEAVYETIKRVVESKYPEGLLTVIAVDDCSTDDSWMWMQRAARHFPQVTVLRNDSNLGKSKSLLRGLSMTTSDLILNVDSDGALHRRAVVEMASCFADRRVGAVGGNVLVRNSSKNWLTQMQTLQYNSIFQTAKIGETFSGAVNCISGAIFMIRRPIYESIAREIETRSWLGYEVREGEDRFMTNLVINRGWRTVVNNRAKVYTDVPDRFATFFSQQLRWRRGFFRTLIWGLKPAVMRTKFRRTSAIVLFRFYFLPLLTFVLPLLLTWLLMTGGIEQLMLMKLELFLLFATIHATNYLVAKAIGNNIHVGVQGFVALPFWMVIDLTIVTALAALTLTSISWETRAK
jgi:hyaluronan synthase